jgi:uncharacterized membrane protein
MPEAAAHRLQEIVDQITGYRQRTRKLVIGLVAVTAVSVLLAGAAVYLFIRQHDSQIDTCNAGNQVRAQQEQLWETLFALSAEANRGKPPDAQGQKLTAEFLHDVKVTYAPVDCAQRYPFW